MNRGLNRIIMALRKQESPWVLGYSGGKDSSAVLSLLLSAIDECGPPLLPVKIVYCDTGVEIPPARLLARQVLRSASKSCTSVDCRVVLPSIEDRFFVKVIGRGYAPPTNRFRWCTDKIRIRPVEKVVSSFAFKKYDLLLGARFGESVARDKVLNARAMRDMGYYSSANKAATRNFLPIFDYSTSEVWETVIQNEMHLGVPASKLLGLYREASGECPIIRDPVSPPCGTARFGCWTCTVVSRDTTTESLIDHGYEALGPLNSFRNWLRAARDLHHWRWPVRRNGMPGPGPFKISARKRILAKLQRAEIECGFRLIGNKEVARIERMWNEDKLLERASCSS